MGIDPDKATDEQFPAFARWWKDNVIPEFLCPLPSPPSPQEEAPGLPSTPRLRGFAEALSKPTRRPLVRRTATTKKRRPSRRVLRLTPFGPVGIIGLASTTNGHAPGKR
jgi:hypothetical protein